MVEFRRPSNIPRFSDPAPQPEPEHASHGPDIRNTDAVLALLDYRAIEVCGRQYRVPPVSGRDGAVLVGLMQRLTKMDAKSEASDYAQLLGEIRHIARRLLIPMGWKQYLWTLHIRRDPLRDATEQETGLVLGFLFKCRTSGHARVSVGRVRQRRATLSRN